MQSLTWSFQPDNNRKYLPGSAHVYISQVDFLESIFMQTRFFEEIQNKLSFVYLGIKYVNFSCQSLIIGENTDIKFTTPFVPHFNYLSLQILCQ